MRPPAVSSTSSKGQSLSSPAFPSLRAGDILVACCLVLVGLYLVAASRGGAPGGRVEITSPKAEPLSFDLRENRTVEVEGLRGTTVVAIDGGGVRFISSPCPHRICIARGRISRCGEWIACIPNGVVATIEGRRTYDGITP